MLPPDARATLRAAAESLACPLDDAQADALLTYLALLARWNKVYNLTAIREPGQMLTQHLIDSLSVVTPLRRHAAGRALSVLDVGSGGGLPGVVLAVMFPEMRMACVDAVAKKASFIRQVAAELKLANLAAWHARVEDLRTAPADLVTSRAFASLSDFVDLTRDRLAPDGAWMAMKGRRPDDEIAALPAEIAVFHVEQLRVPGLNAERCLVWMRQKA